MIRSEILERDDYVCRLCRNEDNLHVHHINWERTCNEETNLVTLCRTCHNAVHRDGYKPHEHEDYPAPWDKTEKRDEYNQEYSW